MQVLYDEEVANHIGPAVVVSREGQGEASAGDRAGWPLSRESVVIPGADGVTKAEGNTSAPRQREWRFDPAWSETPACVGTLLYGNREISWLAAECAPAVRAGKAGGPKPAMNGDEKSDPFVVCAEQRVNQEG